MKIRLQIKKKHIVLNNNKNYSTVKINKKNVFN